MKRTVIVTQAVEVEVDESKFTPEWLAEWRTVFYDFTTVEQHIEHIGQLEARGLFNNEFVEGYGPPSDMGISARVVGQEMEIER